MKGQHGMDPALPPAQGLSHQMGSPNTMKLVERHASLNRKSSRGAVTRPTSCSTRPRFARFWTEYARAARERGCCAASDRTRRYTEYGKCLHPDDSSSAWWSLNPARSNAIERLCLVHLLMWLGGMSGLWVARSRRGNSSPLGVDTISSPPGVTSRRRPESIPWKSHTCSMHWNSVTASQDEGPNAPIAESVEEKDVMFLRRNTSRIVSVDSIANFIHDDGNRSRNAPSPVPTSSTLPPDGYRAKMLAIACPYSQRSDGYPKSSWMME